MFEAWVAAQHGHMPGGTSFAEHLAKAGIKIAQIMLLGEAQAVGGVGDDPAGAGRRGQVGEGALHKMDGIGHASALGIGLCGGNGAGVAVAGFDGRPRGADDRGVGFFQQAAPKRAS